MNFPQSGGCQCGEIRYEITRLTPPAKIAGRVRTEHVCIASSTRGRMPLPKELAEWVGAG